MTQSTKVDSNKYKISGCVHYILCLDAYTSEHNAGTLIDGALTLTISLVNILNNYRMLTCTNISLFLVSR